MKVHYSSRITLISICIFLFAILLVGKLYWLQVVNNDVYIQKADRQYLSTNGTLYSRGSIFFRDKSGTLVSAATLQSGFTVAINPEILKNPEQVYNSLSGIISLDRVVFFAKAKKQSDPYEEIAKRVSTDVGSKISALKIPGLSVYKDRWRFYPGESSAAQVVGLLGFKGNDFAGRYGLERQYNPTLQRSDNTYVNFFAQIFSDIGNAIATTSIAEGDIITSIEPTVESDLEQELATTTKKWNSDYSGGIIMNPTTGEIYAMANFPSFNPNNTEKQKNISVFSNPLVENVYEMGSIIKPLTLAAGIDTGVVTASSTYYDPGYVIVNNKKISNFDGKFRGIVDIQTMLAQSLNVGAAHIESLVGNKRFADYMKSFGLGSKADIDLPNESHNLLDNLKSPRDIEYATASFGQGIALTPISTIRALASLANGGVLVTPHVVSRIVYKTGLFKDTPVETTPSLIKKSSATEVTRMMVWDVDHALFGGTVKLPQYSVAAKTGTAQIAVNGKYSESQILHSFVGFFPAYNPKFFIFLYTVNPKGVKYSSETLTMPFIDLTKFLINYYEVPPDR